MASLITEGPVAGRRPSPIRAARAFPWVVFVLSFALLLSDYMSRQVLAAVFPLLKAQWALTDTQLGALTSIVALTVGVLTVPLSLLGDRWGRVRAIVLMACVWSLATVASAVAANYGQLLAARLFIGVGEAAYGSVGLAVVLAVFPAYRRAALTGTFMAGGSFGSVLGVALGGALAVHFGWRWALGAMAVLGFVIVVLFRLLISDEKLDRHRAAGALSGVPRPTRKRAPLSTLVSTRAVLCAYLGSGCQLFVAGTLLSWLPSYFNRAYHLAPGKAAGLASIGILLLALGMIGCGALTDRLSRYVPLRKWTTAIVYSTASLVFLGLGFSVRPGGLGLLLIAVGCFFSAGSAGPAGAMVANLTAESLRATALGTLTLANNLLGLAAGPFVIGLLADRMGLSGALRIMPLIAVAAIVFFLVGRRAYPAGIRRISASEAA